MKISNLREDTIKVLMDSIEPKDVDIMNMKIDDVLRCLIGERELLDYVEEQDWTTIEKIAFIKGFIDKANKIFSIFKKYSTDVPPEYNQASAEVGDGLSIAEQIITDCVGWYHKTTSEVGELTFFDWYVMKRKESISSAIERKYQNIVNKKYEQQRNSRR